MKTFLLFLALTLHVAAADFNQLLNENSPAGDIAREIGKYPSRPGEKYADYKARVEEEKQREREAKQAEEDAQARAYFMQRRQWTAENEAAYQQRQIDRAALAQARVRLEAEMAQQQRDRRAIAELTDAITALRLRVLR